MLLRADLTLTMTRAQRTGVVQNSPRALRRAFPVREFAALAELVPDEELRESARAAVAASGTDTLRTRLAGAISCVSARRGLVPLGTDADDVIDPYRRPAEVYDESAAQLLPAIDTVIRVVSAVLPDPSA
jgi:protein-tyrosine phosphatase